MHARKNNPAQWLSYISWVLLWWMKTASGSVQGSYSDTPQMKLQVKTGGRHLSTVHSTNSTPKCFNSTGIISQLLSYFPLSTFPPEHQAGRGLSISWPCRVNLSFPSSWPDISRKYSGNPWGNPPCTHTLPLHTWIWPFEWQTQM